MEVRHRNIVMEAVNIEFTYDGNERVLEKVSFSVRKGDVITVLGPNGAGKTTLLKCILRVLKPYGAIYINGKSLRDVSTRDLAKLVGYVPQTHHSIFAYKVIDFVLMGRAPHHSMFSLPSSKEHEKAANVLRTLGVSHLANKTIAELSGGQMQLVLIARAIIQDAKILLLDEPTAHLDITNELKVLQIVRDLVRRGIIDATIMTLHDPMLAALFSTKILLLCNGRVVGYGPPEKVLTENNLREVYNIEFEIMRVNQRILVVPKFAGNNHHHEGQVTNL